MAYNLFIDPQRVMVWGDGTGGSNTVSAMSAEHDFPVYARAPARQNLTPGSYTDIISVTVTYYAAQDRDCRSARYECHRNRCDQVPQGLGGDHLARFLMQLDKGDL